MNSNLPLKSSDFDSIRDWINPLLGPVTGLNVEELGAPFENFSRFVARGKFLDGKQCQRDAAGYHLARNGSATGGVAAVAELLERYSCRFLDGRRCLSGKSQNELNDLGLLTPSERELQRYLPMQFTGASGGYSPYSREFNTHWLPCRVGSLVDEVWVPADFLLMNGPNHLTEGTSNGAAIFTTFEGAQLRAWMELLERHSFTRSWWTGARPHVLPWGVACRVQPLLLELTRSWRDLIPLAFMLFENEFGVPAVALAMRGREEAKEPAVYLGMAAHFSLDQALLRALMEGIQGFHSHVLRRRYGLNGSMFNSDFNESIRTYSDHAAFYALPENAPRLFEVWTCEPNLFAEAELKSIYPHAASGLSDGEAVARIHDLYQSMGRRVLWADLTRPDVRSLGLHVVKALDLRMVPMEASHRWRPWGCVGLVGEEPPTDSMAEAFNPWPHPFA